MTAAAAAAAAVLVYAAICAAAFFAQRSLLYFPQPSSLGHGDATVVVPASDAQVVASMRRPAAATSKAVVYFGGNGEDVTRSIPVLERAFPDRALYLLHYRGYGLSSGAPSERAIVGDALALFDLAHRTHADVEVVGRSLGSGVAVQVASARPVSRLVLVTPYDSVLAIAARRFWFLPVSWLLRDRFESTRYAPGVSAPTVLIAAADDGVIPHASTERLQSAFRPGIASLEVIADADHDSVSSRPGYGPALCGCAPR